MPPKQRKITEVLMQCHRCKWLGTVYECDCDSDYEDVEDEGRLRCPKYMALTQQLGCEQKENSLGEGQARMGRNWVPKYKVKCVCGWTGTRADIGKRCPKCGFWYPKKVKGKYDTS